MVKSLRLREGLIHLFYPRLCEGCSKPLIAAEKVLCVSCHPKISFTNYPDSSDNETVARLAGRFPFVNATSLAYFTNDSLIQHLVHGLKYRGKKENGYFLGKLLGEHIGSSGWEFLPDIIIPVPLHRSKTAKRGYNQSMLIASGMSEVLNTPASDKLLLRVRETESQTRKTRAERLENMDRAFSINPSADLEGKHILLVDDVLTTGATIEACCTTLLTVNNVKISIATVGIAIS